METYKELEKKYTLEEIAESYVFPAGTEGHERDEVLSAFRTFRKEKASAQSEENKYRTRLLQLRFILEDYIASPLFEEKYDFAYFLDQYITRLEMNYKEFAKNIEVGASTISQIIGKHRKPTDKIIYRIHIHSNKNFPAALWYKLLEKEKIYELEHDKSILQAESKHVTHSLNFSF
jgi:plasmid maintenance system antidote protein VapI